MNAERLGQQLRTAREARELTIEDVEQALRIRSRFLEAFETGAYEDLPGAVQARGFLRNYARFLKLDEDVVLAEYDAVQVALPPEQRTPAMPRVVSAPPPTAIPAPPTSDPVPGAVSAQTGRGRRVGVVLGAIIGLVAMLGACYGGVQFLERFLNEQAGQGGPDLVSILPTVPSLTPSATFLASATPLPGARVIDGATPITGRVVLDIAVVQRSFVRVTVDGVLAFEGIVRPGTQLEYQAQQTLTLEASNGSALDVVFNNLPLGLLGQRGEVVEKTFTPEMVLTPTVPVIPTATETPVPLAVQPAAEATTALEVEDAATVDAADSGKGGQGQAVPTALPLPDSASDVTGATVAPQATLDTGASVDTPPTALPALTQPSFELPSATVPPSATLPPTATPTQTFTPSPTLSPTPTVVLPPRQTSTPIPQK